MNFVLSPISIPDLINQIANEIEARLQRQQQLSIASSSDPTEPIRLYGDKAASQYLNCSVMTMQSLRRSGAIPFYRTGRKVFFISTELDSALKVQSRKFGNKPSNL